MRRTSAVLLLLAGVATLVAATAASTQFVTCTVTTAQLEATARAELGSVCSTKEMESQMLHFEKQMTEKLEDIEATISSLANKLAEHGKQYEYFLQPRMIQDIPQRDEKAAETLVHKQKSPNEETANYNPLGSTHMKRVFEYRWNVTGLQRETLRSPSFYVFPRGYRMYLRLRGMGQAMFAYAGLTRGDYDHTLGWPFPLRHKVQVVSGRELLESRLWDPAGLCGLKSWQRPRTGDNAECMGFAFPSHALQRNSIVIKLIVLLE